VKTSLAATLEAALPDQDSTTVFISRLASPELRGALAGSDVREVVAVRGRAVWPDPNAGTTICEWPGWVGQTEAPPGSPSVCVSASGSRPGWSCDSLIVAESSGYGVVESDWTPDPTAQADYAERTSRSRRLVSQLTQTRGVAAAWPVHSPRALLLLPIPPASALRSAPPPQGLTVAPLDHFPEFPGGLRIEMRALIDRNDLRSWSAEFTAAVTSGERTT
jgi:hypothetical protein